MQYHGGGRVRDHSLRDRPGAVVAEAGHAYAGVSAGTRRPRCFPCARRITVVPFEPYLLILLTRYDVPRDSCRRLS